MSGDEYKAVYKCRLCGERYTDCITGRATAVGIAYELAVGVGTHIPQAPTMRTVHLCKNGGIGMSDFQGWEVRQ